MAASRVERQAMDSFHPLSRVWSPRSPPSRRVAGELGGSGIGCAWYLAWDVRVNK